MQMEDISGIVIIIIAMIMLAEMIIMTIPDKNKKNGGRLLARTTYNPGMVRGGLIAFALCGLFAGFMFVKSFFDGSISVFFEEKYNFLEIIKSGETPNTNKDAVIYVKTVGETFRIDGADGKFCPVMVCDENGEEGSHVICCLHLSSKKNESLNEAYRANPEIVHKYVGRVYDFSAYADPYGKAVGKSGMSGEGYVVSNYIFETYGNSEGKKYGIIWMGVTAVGCLICFVVVRKVWKKRTSTEG